MSQINCPSPPGGTVTCHGDSTPLCYIEDDGTCSGQCAETSADLVEQIRGMKQRGMSEQAIMRRVYSDYLRWLDETIRQQPGAQQARRADRLPGAKTPVDYVDASGRVVARGPSVHEMIQSIEDSGPITPTRSSGGTFGQGQAG